MIVLIISQLTNCSRNKKEDSFPLPDSSADTGQTHIPDPVGVAGGGESSEGEEETVKKKKKGKSKSNKKQSKVTIIWLSIEAALDEVSCM